MHELEALVKAQKNGESKGICSVCSSNVLVIDAAIIQAREKETPVLIEATANQVNQMGGYTGMKPADFREFVYERADEMGLPRDRVILGGDHLGPVAWQKKPRAEAMEIAKELVYEFAKAGYTKIHLDASMPLGDDGILGTEEIADRTVELCKEAERGFSQWKAGLSQEDAEGAEHPVYVIGSEVPTPGGSGDEDELTVTKPEDLLSMLEIFEEKFKEAGLEDSWKKVVAAVVQPGVEFGNRDIHEYVREEAAELMSTAKKLPNIVLEGHSTDYQPEERLRELVEDGVAILKVGPALTFAAREGLFQLDEMEEELGVGDRTHFPEVLDEAMLKDPSKWQGHYTTEEPESSYLRKYSLSDRCRYYMNTPEVEGAINKLFKNLMAKGEDPYKLVIDKVRETLDIYWRACGR